MSIAASSRPLIATPMMDGPAQPVDIETTRDAGKVWLKPGGQAPILATMENVWEITEAPDQQGPRLRMNFRATTEDGRQFWLFQDLLDGKWYRELPPSDSCQGQ